MSEDFLTRESVLLGSQFSPSANGTGTGGADFDFDRAASAFPDIEGLEGDILTTTQPLPQPTKNQFDFDFGPAVSAPARTVKVTERDEIDQFETAFPELEPQAPFSPPVNQIASQAPTFAPKPTPSAALNAPVLQHVDDDEEPEVIKQWREKQAKEIRERDAASEAKREEAIRKAEKAIDNFYEDYNATKEKNIKANKEAEQAYLTSLRDSLSEGTTWSRICTLIELENSQSKTLARAGPGTSDLTRYKEVLLRMKREGENAPGAAGY